MAPPQCERVDWLSVFLSPLLTGDWCFAFGNLFYLSSSWVIAANPLEIFSLSALNG